MVYVDYTETVQFDCVEIFQSKQFMICFAGRGRILHTDLDPATFEEIVLEVDLCTVSQLKVDPAESCFSMMLVTKISSTLSRVL